MMSWLLWQGITTHASEFLEMRAAAVLGGLLDSLGYLPIVSVEKSKAIGSIQNIRRKKYVDMMWLRSLAKKALIQWKLSSVESKTMATMP